MNVSPLAGKPVEQSQLVDVPRLITAFYSLTPDVEIFAQRVAFGTSGHRGSAFDTAFNEAHILAICQAICLYRKTQNISGPLYLGMDTHALSVPAFTSAIEVLAANGVETMVDSASGYTPTPAISHAILAYNRGRKSGLADGIVITPSHNPPSDGGFKYNPPNGGPADTAVTNWIQNTANDFLRNKLEGVQRAPYERALTAATLHKHDYIGAYVGDLGNVVDMESIRSAGVQVGIDPLGGAAVHYWPAMIEKYGIEATVVSDLVDPTFRFMTADWDGKIRMDCSSPYAMVRLLAMRDRFDVAFANDTDADRHGIVTRSSGLMNPNHYLAVAISYLFRNRTRWRKDAAVGKTVVSSSMIDRVAASLERKLIETPVGFKWFVDGLIDGSVGFCGEESAGASFLRTNGTVWTTDKDGLILGLLAAEMTAREGRDPGAIYNDLTKKFGAPAYERIDAPATLAQKEILRKLAPEQVNARELAGEKIFKTLTAAPGNGAGIGGIKVIAESGWFAARPSGTEEVYKIYAESFRGVDHLHRIQTEAQELIARVFKQAESGKSN
ncbi:MAG TPA: phosphoglucomutase (alpha-D-glucose-1,6-bisphosphate-dependent) [Candidatus Binatus sp.]|uniref:phosphoglucomutase (alpha-D-glucose-1,6-bisphosphate-dependent) n=1 Tax=Candidatus Binatus sp. TaxID=2811406 RepID=UPI002B48DB00|nr:phosphoglucomutase (alpha-D-glucose-1,6-bisphosphate-dependent) [Candidatus Binatus sp.]HKN13394.1 phosphoglucomutase (alpha-D-glucose-1,6-bisphosphate-dependent) [Candidatus Binatus sp.]